jgi:hypothetical protein
MDLARKALALAGWQPQNIRSLPNEKQWSVTPPPKPIQSNTLFVDTRLRPETAQK